MRQEKQCLVNGKQWLLSYSAGHPVTAATCRGALRSDWGQRCRSGDEAGLKQPRFPVQGNVPLSEYTCRLNWKRFKVLKTPPHFLQTGNALEVSLWRH